ncbi:MAG TPA: hypothetical protein VNX28_06305 [Gemmataceae bacterium]|jgi:hypothetical protein|nr:hypothetical protein [Gemmataceae bacterium]
MDTDTTDDQSSDCCLRCGKELLLGSDACYLIKVEAMADPSPPVIAAEDVTRGEIERLLAQMDDLSPQEAMDQVYRRLSFYLCGPCYRQWIEKPAG